MQHCTLRHLRTEKPGNFANLGKRYFSLTNWKIPKILGSSDRVALCSQSGFPNGRFVYHSRVYSMPFHTSSRPSKHSQWRSHGYDAGLSLWMEHSMPKETFFIRDIFFPFKETKNWLSQPEFLDHFFINGIHPLQYVCPPPPPPSWICYCRSVVYMVYIITYA